MPTKRDPELIRNLLSSVVNGLMNRDISLVQEDKVELSRFDEITTLRKCLEAGNISSECRIEILKAYLRLFPAYNLMADLGLQKVDTEDELDVLMDIRMTARMHKLDSAVEDQLYSIIPKKLKAELEKKESLADSVRSAYGYSNFKLCLNVAIKVGNTDGEDFSRDVFFMMSTEPALFLNESIKNMLKEAETQTGVTNPG